jgi:hypothetical protein
MDEFTPNLLSRKDSIYGIIEFLTLAKLVQIQYLNKDFFNKVIPNMTKRIYWRKPSGKEEYTQPVNIKNDEFRKVYYSRFKNIISLGLFEIEIDENFLKTFKIVVENNYQNLEVLELFYISFKNEELANEFLKLVLCLNNITKLEINNNLSLPFQTYFSDHLLKETSFFMNLKFLSFHYIDFIQIEKLLYSCEKLESLHLTSSKLSIEENFNKFIEYLNCSRLINISFQFEDFEQTKSKQFLSSLRQSNHLRTLVFDNCNFNGLEGLKYNSDLFSNNLHLSKISVINSKNIMEFLIHLINPQSLEKIQLSSCYINDNLLEIFSNSLIGCKFLHSIDLGHNKFTYSGLKYLLTKLESEILSTLIDINLAGNKGIENEGLSTLVHYLINIPTISLKKINLTNCGIDMNISQELISYFIYTMLFKNSSFELILLRNSPNKISDIQVFINKFGGKINSLNLSNVKGSINLYAFKLDYKKIDSPTIEMIDSLRVKHGIILN